MRRHPAPLSNPPQGAHRRALRLLGLALLAGGGAALLGCGADGAAPAGGLPDGSGAVELDAAPALGSEDASWGDVLADAGSGVVDLSSEGGLSDAGSADEDADGASTTPGGLPPIDRRTHQQTAQATFALG